MIGHKELNLELDPDLLKEGLLWLYPREVLLRFSVSMLIQFAIAHATSLVNCLFFGCHRTGLICM